MGAIKGTVLAAVDKRIKASVVALTGGDLPYIIAYTKETGIRKRVMTIIEKDKLTAEELRARLATTIKTDPIKLAKYIDARKILVALALFDNVVHYKKGRELLEAIGLPDRIYILSAHYSAAFYAIYLQGELMAFFREHLEPLDKTP